MSAFPSPPPYPQDAYTRMWEEVDDPWNFDAVDDWNDWDEQPAANDHGSIYGYEFERSTPDALRSRREESRGGRRQEQHSHETSVDQSRIRSGAASTRNSQPNDNSQPSQSRTLQQRRFRPIATHNNDWLDPSTATEGPFQRRLDAGDWFETVTDENTGSEDFQSLASPQSAPVEIDNSAEEDEAEVTEEEMSTSGRRPRASLVDLTDERSSPAARQPRSLKRAAEEAESSRGKRRRSAVDVEELDLTSENPSAEDELAQSATAATIARQQSNDEPSGPLKIGKRQCIICMESYTNATVTHCGHIYCHECLWQALRAGEKSKEAQGNAGAAATGNCPVCRKSVKRVGKDGKQGQMVAVSFMTKKGFQRGLGKKERTGMGVLG